MVFSDLGNEAFIIWNGDSDINDEIYLTNIDYANIDDGKNEVNNKNVGTKMNTTLTYDLGNYFPLSNIDIKYPNNSTSLNTTYGIRIALVDPTFTNAAYDNSFYIFYNLYNNFSLYQTTTKYLNLLESKTDKDSMLDYTELYLQNHISNLMPSANVTIISDLDVHYRNIFNDNTITSNKYDVMILGHQEYVTQKEYEYLRQFVANGGILILPYSNILYAEINYNPKDNTVVLVKGHSWDFDGKSATKNIIAERWINETSEWIGSNYANQSSGIIFGNNPFGYLKHEEQFITNPKVNVLLDYNVTLPTINPKDFHDFRIAAYEHNYKEGKVIQFGIYPSDDVLNNDRFNRFFDSILLKYIN